MSHKRALLLLALCATMWSLGGLLIKSISLHPLAIAGYRSFICIPILWVACRKPKFIFTKAQIGASIMLSLTVILFVTATKLTTAANAILLQYSAPIYVALLSAPLLKEKVNKKDWLVLGVVLFGMVLFFLEKVSNEHFLGNLIALLSGVSFAGIALFLRMQKGQSTMESLLLGQALTALISLPFVFSAGLPNADDSIRLLILGVVQLGIPYALYAIAIRHVTALEATLIPVIEPILNPIWVAIFLGETPSGYAMIGGSIVLLAVLAHSFIGKRWKAESAPI